VCSLHLDVEETTIIKAFTLLRFIISAITIILFYSCTVSFFFFYSRVLKCCPVHAFSNYIWHLSEATYVLNNNLIQSSTYFSKGATIDQQSKFRLNSICIQVAKFLVPYGRDKVDFDITLSYLPASQCSLTGRYDNPML
jgi:hypothetical protein